MNETGEKTREKPKIKEPAKAPKTKYYVERNDLFVKFAVALLALSVLFRLIGYWGFWKSEGIDDAFTQVYLPILCCALFAVLLELLGKAALWTTSIPAFFTAVFLILETFSVTPWWVKVLSILLYVVAACVYTVTVFGKIGSKWPLVVTIGTPLVYHLAVQDRTTLLNASTPATLVEWMPELSAMSFLIALLFVALDMEKVLPPLPEGAPPRIRGLGYVPPELDFHMAKKPEAPAKAEEQPAEALPEDKTPKAPADTGENDTLHP